jgi:hypothetical protein
MSVAEVMLDSLPVRKDSLAELIGHRNRALELARQGVLLLAEAEQAAKRAAPMEAYAGFVREMFERCGYALTHIEGDHHRAGRDALAEAMAVARKHIDEHAWQSLQRLSGLRNLMDVQATKDFAKQLSEDPPPFCLDNITSTYMQLAADAGEIFERGLVNVFHGLNSRRYKTNSAFRLGKRAVLTGVLGTFHRGWNHYASGRETLADLDRCFHVLDGKKPPETSNAADAIEQAYNAGRSTVDTPYFSARLFPGNKNIHLTFTRLDLVERANDIVAKHSNGGLPDDTKVAA